MSNFNKITPLSNKIDSLLLDIKEVKPNLYREYTLIVDYAINGFIDLGANYIEDNPQEFEIFLKKLNDIIKILAFIKTKENIQEEKSKRDRCLRIADRKFDKPSAYKSGAVVRCRKGDIWKGLNEYNNVGPSTPKTYIVKNDGTYKEVPIKLLSKIPNLIYDMGGGETNYYPEENIVIVDNIPIEEFAENPGDIKDKKIYVEYNLNLPTSLPKANKIIAAQLVYHLDDVKSFAKTVDNSLKDGGIFEFFSDVMSKEDKIFLEYLSSEFGFGIPTTLSKYKNSIIKIKKGEYVKPIESYTYEVTDDAGNVSKISATKKGGWWKYVKVEGNLNFKPIEALNPEHYNQLGLESNEALKKQLSQFSEILGHNIINIKKINQLTEYSKVTEEMILEKVKETLRTWFSRKGEPGKKGGWVDCNTCREVDGKTKCKACGREKGEKRAEYPSCRPTAAQCKTPGKGTKWGKTK
jgi:hypothetical protein